MRFLKALSLAAALVLVGCATTPTVERAPGAAAAWLGKESRVVVRVDAAQVTAWGAVTRQKEALKTVGERARVVWMGFEMENLDDLSRAADSVRLVLEGDFPQGAAGFLLDWNAAWTKSSPPGVWTNAALDLSVSLPEDGLVAVRRGDASHPEPSPGVLRDLDPMAMSRSAVWASFWQPSEALFGATGAKLLPIERLDVVLQARTDVLEGPVLLHFGDERAARAAVVVLRLLALPLRARLGQDLEWSLEGTTVVGEGLRLRQSDVKALAERLVADPKEATR